MRPCAAMPCAFAPEMARRLRAASEDLVKSWLELIAQFSALNKREVFPGHDLIDHVPTLIDGIAGYIEDPSLEITADAPVMAKAIELGRLRYEQGFDASRILKEYEFLGNVLFDFLVQKAEAVKADCTRAELLVCGHRVFHSIAVIQQHTTEAFLSLDDERVKEREQRLRGFNRLVSHELKDRIAAAWSAAQLMQDQQVEGNRDRYVEIIARNLATVHEIIDDLVHLSHTTEPGADSRREPLSDIVTRVIGELQDFTERRNVRIELAEDLPAVNVPAAAVELALRNLISNAAKYRDESKDDRWMRIEAVVRAPDAETCEIEVRVRDNGVGVPVEDRENVFQRGYRAHGGLNREPGSGLGLSIVRETLEHQGGRVWAEFPREGSVFGFEVPCTAPATAQ